MENEKPKDMGDIYMMGIDPDSYNQLFEIAKKENKAVTDVISNALKKHIASKQNINEVRERKILTEG